MPVTTINKLRENTFLIVWEITESNFQLQELLHARLHDWHAQDYHRENKHWLASRLAILHHFRNEEVDLIKDIYNKPHLKVEEKDVYVSITHSFDKAAVILSTDHMVAMDLERIDNRISRVMHKFCNQTELAFAAGDTKKLTIIWAAKETLYKWYGKKELDFKDYMTITPFEINQSEFEISGAINKADYRVVCTIKTEIKDGYVTTYIA